MKRLISSIRGWSLACVLLLVVGVCSTAAASDPTNDKKSTSDKGKDKETEKSDGVIKIPVELVLLDVAVLDHSHRAVGGLNRDQFHIFEDKIQQRIEYFTCDDVPVSVGFVIDTSGSMRKKLPVVIEAAKAMVRMARPGDEFFVVQFKEQAHLVEEFTTKTDEVEEALDNLIASSGTALLDAIFVSADYAFKEARNRRKALIVISDGDERDSFYRAEKLIDHIREQDVQVYVIGFPDELDDSNSLFHGSLRSKAVKLINQIAEESGGRAFFPKGLFEVGAITEQIGCDVHSQYTIGYYSSNEKRDGTWRRVQIKLQETSKKNLAVRTRSGYFAAGGAQKP